MSQVKKLRAATEGDVGLHGVVEIFLADHVRVATRGNTCVAGRQRSDLLAGDIDLHFGFQLPVFSSRPREASDGDGLLPFP